MYLTTGEQLWQWYQQAKHDAIAAGIEPREIDWLLQEVSSLDSLALRLESFRQQNQVSLQIPLSQLAKLWQKRWQNSLPVQYLVGKSHWRNFQLQVSSAVLIPRPETEEIIDLAIVATQGDFLGNWVDLGTGSGAISLALATAFPQAIIHAVDVSAAALAIAQENAAQLDLSHKIKFYQGSWWEPLEHLTGQVRGMVSNPPYIPSSLVPQLQPEVAKHEPHLALDGGEDGLDCLRHLVTTAPQYLCSGGIWLVEMMVGQAKAVTQLLQGDGRYRDIQVFADLGGVERFVLAERI